MARKKSFKRVDRMGLDDVCLDCCDFVKKKYDCKNCAITKLKWNL